MIHEFFSYIKLAIQYSEKINRNLLADDLDTDLFHNVILNVFMLR